MIDSVHLWMKLCFSNPTEERNRQKMGDRTLFTECALHFSVSREVFMLFGVGYCGCSGNSYSGFDVGE